MEDDSSEAIGYKDVDEKSVDKESSTGRRGGVCFYFDFRRDPAMSLERISRILFPISFLAFCLIYWSYYLEL